MEFPGYNVWVIQTGLNVSEHHQTCLNTSERVWSLVDCEVWCPIVRHTPVYQPFVQDYLVSRTTCHTSLNGLVRCTSEAFFRWLCAIYRYKDGGTVAKRVMSAPHPPVTTDWKCGNGWLRVEVYVVLWQNGWVDAVGCWLEWRSF